MTASSSKRGELAGGVQLTAMETAIGHVVYSMERPPRLQKLRERDDDESSKRGGIVRLGLFDKKSINIRTESRDDQLSRSSSPMYQRSRDSNEPELTVSRCNIFNGLVSISVLSLICGRCSNVEGTREGVSLRWNLVLSTIFETSREGSE